MSISKMKYKQSGFYSLNMSLLLHPALYAAPLIAAGRYALIGSKSSMLVPQLTVILLCVTLILTIMMGNVAGVLRSIRELFWLWLFSIYVMITYFISPDPSLAFGKVVELLVVVAISLVFIRISYDPRFVKLFAIGAFWFTGALALIGIVSFTGTRLSVLGGGPNIFARFMYLGVLTSIYWLETSRRYRIPMIVSLLAFYAVMLMSGSRGAFIAGGVTTLFWLFTSPTLARRRHVFVFIAVLAGLGANALSIYGPSWITQRYSETIVSDGAGSGAVRARIFMYEEGLEFFRERPLTGYGIGSLPALSVRGGYPHNIFVEILGELGGIGLLLFGAFVVSQGTRVSFRRWKRDPGALYFAGIFLFSLIASQFSGDLFDARWVFISAAVFPNVSRRALNQDAVRPS